MNRFVLPFLLLTTTSVVAAPCQLVRQAYAPAENLEAIDVELISRARQRIDFTAYVLTSLPIVRALDDAAARG